MSDRHRRQARPVFAWLSEDATARALAQQADRMVALQSALALASPLPGLIALDLDAAGVLRVASPSAATAAKLRQMEPSLVAGLQRRGWPVERIRVRPQPREGSAPPPEAPPRDPMPAQALADFGALAREAPEGALKEALQALLRHAGRR